MKKNKIIFFCKSDGLIKGCEDSFKKSLFSVFKDKPYDCFYEVIYYPNYFEQHDLFKITGNCKCPNKHQFESLGQSNTSPIIKKLGEEDCDLYVYVNWPFLRPSYYPELEVDDKILKEITRNKNVKMISLFSQYHTEDVKEYVDAHQNTCNGIPLIPAVFDYNKVMSYSYFEEEFNFLAQDIERQKEPNTKSHSPSLGL